MKKLLPTLIPLLGTALTALSPAVQAFIVSFVTTHPAWAATVATAAAVLNHWLPSPNALPSAAAVAKSGLSVLLCVLLVGLPLTTTGCSYNQADVVKAVQNAENGFKTAKALLPQAQIIVGELKVVEPDVAEYLQPLVNGAGPALDKLTAACDAYLANPGSDAYQAILNAADAFTAQLDQAALATLRIKNPTSQQKAAVWIALFSTGMHVGLGLLQNYATSKQLKAMPKIAHVAPEQWRQFVDRDYARQELAGMGYNADAALTAAGF